MTVTITMRQGEENPVTGFPAGACEGRSEADSAPSAPPDTGRRHATSASRTGQASARAYWRRSRTAWSALGP